jgi:hypothetical protein
MRNTLSKLKNQSNNKKSVGQNINWTINFIKIKKKYYLLKCIQMSHQIGLDNKYILPAYTDAIPEQFSSNKNPRLIPCSVQTINIPSLTASAGASGTSILQIPCGSSAGLMCNPYLRLSLQTAQPADAATKRDLSIQRQNADTLSWPTQITAEMLSVALLRPDRMRTIDLFTYIRHLEANGQTAQRYEIEFWKKVFYPLSCLVMVVLALPFAYLNMRSGSIATYVFGGVMIGISFFLLNNVFGYIGNLSNWQPWFAAAAPGLLYSAISLTAFGWLVLRR